MPSLLRAVTTAVFFVACTSGSNDDEEEAAAGAAGAGNSQSGGSNAGGKSSAGSSAGGSNAGGSNAGGNDAGGQGGSDGSCCVEETLSWGRVGGNVIYTDTSALASCAVFTHERASPGEPPSQSCTQGVAVACGEDGVGADDLVAALGHPDVEAAIAEAPVLYGTDPRPYDGQVVQIAIADAVIEIGAGTAIPEGVQALADLLLALTEQELALAPCANIFE